MGNIYVYYGDKKELKKLLNLSLTIQGLSCVSSYGIDEYCGLKLSDKLERRLKLLTFDTKRPRKITYLYNVISKSKIYSEIKYKKKCEEDYINKKKQRYSDGSYKKLPKGITKDNQDDYNRSSGHQSGTGKSFCTKCHFTHKSYPYQIGNRDTARKYGWVRYKENIKCSNCGAENSSIWLHSSVRVPKKNASEKVWKNFYKLFVDKKKN